ncbi:MAG: DUF6164 family protein [Acidiferrobacterales bacterium]
MSVRIYEIPGGTEEEREEEREVRALLDGNDVDYYDVPGYWPWSTAALWVNRKEDYKKARRLIDDYQRERAWIVRQRYERERRLLSTKPFSERVAIYFSDPRRRLVVVGAILAIAAMLVFGWLR